MIETAKANGLEPYWYLKYLFENLPEAMTADEFIALMPQNIDKALIAGPRQLNYTRFLFGTTGGVY